MLFSELSECEQLCLSESYSVGQGRLIRDNDQWFIVPRKGKRRLLTWGGIIKPWILNKAQQHFIAWLRTAAPASFIAAVYNRVPHVPQLCH